jgi:hypothetical protein
MQSDTSTLTDAQERALRALCSRYSADFDIRNYSPQFDLPDGWVGGWAGPIYIGCDPEGNIHS